MLIFNLFRLFPSTKLLQIMLNYAYQARCYSKHVATCGNCHGLAVLYVQAIQFIEIFKSGREYPTPPAPS